MLREERRVRGRLRSLARPRTRYRRSRWHYLWLTFASAVAVAFVGVRVLRRARLRAFVTGKRLDWTDARPEVRHLTGSIVFGGGLEPLELLPDPIAAQLGQGSLWSVFTIAGIGLGILLYLRRAS